MKFSIYALYKDFDNVVTHLIYITTIFRSWTHFRLKYSEMEVYYMPEIEALAYNLKRLRRKMHATQFEFASECGISTETLSILECEKGDPKLSTLQKIAAYADCEVAELIDIGKYR